MGGTSLARRVYLWVAGLFLASVVVQVFLIGLYLFNGADLGLHQGFGYLVLLLSIVVVGAAFAARLPGRSKRLTGLLVLVTIVQVMLAGLKSAGFGLIAALHPVNALLVFGVGLTVLRDAQAQARVVPSAPVEPPSASEAPAALS